MAESDWQRDEWITAMNNNRGDRGKGSEVSAGGSKEAERIRSVLHACVITCLATVAIGRRGSGSNSG